MLNDAKLRAAKPQAKPYKLTDSHRLYLLVTPSGGKLWRWNYVFGDKQKSLAFGAYPLVSLIDARAMRDTARANLLEGRDPAIVRKLEVEANLRASACTFEKVALEWHEVSKGQWAATHAGDVLRSLKRDIFPEIGEFPVAEIQPSTIFRALRAIEDRGSIETAKRVRQRISAVFVYAIAQGIAKDDPAEKLGGALKPVKKGKQPAIVDLSQLRRMIAAAEADYARPITRLALRLLALTAVRPNEIRGATWEELDNLDGPEPVWRIPAARMKGDRARKEEINGDHLVPLSTHSVEVLRALWSLTGSGSLLFPNSRHLHRPMSENAIGYLLNRAGYHGHHVPHGFRAAFSTIMNEWAERHGKPSDRAIIDLMLAHVPKKKVEGAYNRAAYMMRRRELAQAWGDMLLKGLSAPIELLRRPAREMRVGHEKRVPALKAALGSPFASQATGAR